VLKVAELVGRADFDAGPLHISPGRRLVEGPAGSAHLEPIVMKVFLLLLDAAGSVVTRNELFDQAWGGVFVGDDSLNRAIARVRKIASETAPGSFEIETIPRTGYHVTGDIVEHLGAAQTRDGDRPVLSRRTVVGAGVASLALAGGIGVWTISRKNQQRHEELLKQAEEALEYNDGSERPASLLRQAVAAQPDDARAQGLLAFALVANNEDINSRGRSSSADGAADAVSMSLRLDPTNVDAGLARILLERSTLDLTATEDRLRALLAKAPNNVFVMRNLWNMLQTVGRSHDALDFVQQALAIKPLAASNNFPLAQLLWITGQTAAADRVIDRALQFWPEHPVVRFARFTISAFTGRTAVAREMLEDPKTRPQIYSPEALSLWQLSLTALEAPSPANVTRVRHAYRVAVTEQPRLANQAVMVLSALGDVDSAFEIANKLLLFRAGPPGTPSRSTAWRFTPWLFTPPVAAMRADPRFVTLCDGIGLTDYWEKRGVRPDYKIGHR